MLQKRNHNAALHLICAVPHPGFENKRSEYEKERYMHIIQNADYAATISDHYFRACYQRRNEFMVDHSNLVIAVWNGTPSGTKNTIDYANRKGVKVVNVFEAIMQ